MKSYAKKPANKSNALSKEPSASKQASIDDILQAQRDGTLGKRPIQREIIGEKVIQGEFDEEGIKYLDKLKENASDDLNKKIEDMETLRIVIHLQTNDDEINKFSRPDIINIQENFVEDLLYKNKESKARALGVIAHEYTHAHDYYIEKGGFMEGGTKGTMFEGVDNLVRCELRAWHQEAIEPIRFLCKELKGTEKLDLKKDLKNADGGLIFGFLKFDEQYKKEETLQTHINFILSRIYAYTARALGKSNTDSAVNTMAHKFIAENKVFIDNIIDNIKSYLLDNDKINKINIKDLL